MNRKDAILTLVSYANSQNLLDRACSEAFMQYRDQLWAIAAQLQSQVGSIEQIPSIDEIMAMFPAPPDKPTV